MLSAKFWSHTKMPAIPEDDFVWGKIARFNYKKGDQIAIGRDSDLSCSSLRAEFGQQTSIFHQPYNVIVQQFECFQVKILQDFFISCTLPIEFLYLFIYLFWKGRVLLEYINYFCCLWSFCFLLDLPSIFSAEQKFGSTKWRNWCEAF